MTRPRHGKRAPTQLALALDHAESLAREDFLAGPSNAAALALVERWPDWPARTVLLRGPEGSGKSHLAAIWAREAGARMLVAARARRRRSAGGARDRRAGAGKSRRRATSTKRALFHLLNLAREERAYRADHRAHARRRTGARGCPISPRGCARCRWSRSRRPTMRCCARCSSSCSPTGSLRSTRPGVVISPMRIERSFAAARDGGGRARPRGAAPAAAGDPGAGRRTVPRSLDGSAMRVGHVIGRHEWRP